MNLLKKPLQFLKLQGISYQDKELGYNDETDKVNASSVYLNEILQHSPPNKKINMHHQTSGLNERDFLHYFSKEESDEMKIPSTQNIRNVFDSQVAHYGEEIVCDGMKAVDFTKTFEKMFEESRNKRVNSSQFSDDELPVKKAKSNLSTYSEGCPFNNAEFIASTQKDFDKDLITQESKNNGLFSQFKNPWSESSNTTISVKKNPYANPYSKQKEKEAQNMDPANSGMLEVKNIPEFKNPWSFKKDDDPTTSNKTPSTTSLSSWSNKIKPQTPDKPPTIPPWPSKAISRDKINATNELKSTNKLLVPENTTAMDSKFFANSNNSSENPTCNIPEKKDPFSSFKTAGQFSSWLNSNKNTRSTGLSKSNCPSTMNVNGNNNDPLRKKFQVPLKSMIQDKSNDMNDEDFTHPLLKGIDKDLLMRIHRDIVCDSSNVRFDDIAGLEKAKQAIYESIIFPAKHPELFTGLRRAARAILLFGPPGNGKTLIGKAIANEVDANFMSISSSTLTSKWMGESENLVKALFTYAIVKQPTIIFFDEVDSLLTSRGDDSSGKASESTNRIKTEFLVQLDGANSMKDNDRVIFIGATNRPESIDEAMRRRFTKRILIPLPIEEARVKLIMNLVKDTKNLLTNEDYKELGKLTQGFSGADIKNLATEASMHSVRKLLKNNMYGVNGPDSIPPIVLKHFIKALKTIKPSVDPQTLVMLEEWNNKFGTGGAEYNDDDDDSDDDDI